MPDSALTGFRMLVTTYKFGGESNFAKFIPLTDTPPHNRHTTWFNARPAHRYTPAQLLATRLGTVSPGADFALHPDYVSLIPMWNAGDLAIVPNCGVLIDPIPTLPPAANIRIPSGVGAHDTFQDHHSKMTGAMEPLPRGWLGAVSDLASPFVGNPTASRTAIFNSSTPVDFMGLGSSTVPFALSGAGVGVVMQGTGGGNASDIEIRNRIAAAVAVPRSAVRQQVYQNAFAATIAGTNFYNPIQTTAFDGTPPATYLVDQDFAGAQPSAQNWRSIFWRIARLAEDAIGNRNGGTPTRMNVLANLPDYDTHGGEQSRFVALAIDYGTGLRDFRAAMIRLGIWQQVVVTDPSDFGRTLWTNGGDGTDHAWGYAMFIAGGAVRGVGRAGSNGFLGPAFPVRISTDGSGTRDWSNAGLLTPDVSLEEVYDDILAWYGMNLADRQIIMPNRGNFSNFLDVMV